MQSFISFGFTWEPNNSGELDITIMEKALVPQFYFQVTGLDGLCELKVLNLAGNLIRKISNLNGLTSLEELNIRRNRIRSTQGLEVVPSLEKLYMSNNELQV
jgi:Leucine-rich repeat (LRR) protein